MAVDDVISDYFTDVANASAFSIQPASGDEWLITHVLVEETGPWYINPHTTAANWEVGLFGGATGRNSNYEEYGVQQVRFFLTNSEYIRLYNYSGGTDSAGFSGIKIKE